MMNMVGAETVKKNLNPKKKIHSIIEITTNKYIYTDADY